MVTVTFENPQFLWFLVALPLLIVSHFFLLRTTKKKALKFANFVVLKRATGNRFITKNYTILLIRVFVVALAILALARMHLWYEAETNENEYVLALDTSASMSAQDIPPTRLEAAKEYGGKFLDDIDGGTKIGLVSFSGVTFIESPLTEEHGAVRSALESLQIEASGTDIPGAIITSTNLLETSTRGRAIVLITDGSNTIETFQSKSLQRAVDYAIANRVKVYTIGVGSEGGVVGYLPTYYNISSQYNEDNLAYIANATGGTYFEAADTTQLEQAYDQALSRESVSLLQKDLTPGLMLIAFILILVEWGLISTRYRLLP